MATILVEALVWSHTPTYSWAAIGPCGIRVKRWRESKERPWQWSVHEIFGAYVYEPAFPTQEQAQRRAEQMACERFAVLKTYFRKG